MSSSNPRSSARPKSLSQIPRPVDAATSASPTSKRTYRGSPLRHEIRRSVTPPSSPTPLSTPNPTPLNTPATRAAPEYASPSTHLTQFDGACQMIAGFAASITGGALSINRGWKSKLSITDRGSTSAPTPSASKTSTRGLKPVKKHTTAMPDMSVPKDAKTNTKRSLSTVELKQAKKEATDIKEAEKRAAMDAKIKDCQERCNKLMDKIETARDALNRPDREKKPPFLSVIAARTHTSTVTVGSYSSPKEAASEHSVSTTTSHPSLVIATLENNTTTTTQPPSLELATVEYLRVIDTLSAGQFAFAEEDKAAVCTKPLRCVSSFADASRRAILKRSEAIRFFEQIEHAIAVATIPTIPPRLTVNFPARARLIADLERQKHREADLQEQLVHTLQQRMWAITILDDIDETIKTIIVETGGVQSPLYHLNWHTDQPEEPPKSIYDRPKRTAAEWKAMAPSY